MTDLENRPKAKRLENVRESVVSMIEQSPVSETTMLGIFEVLRNNWVDRKSAGDCPDLRQIVTALAQQLELDRPSDFAGSFQLLIRGAASAHHEERVQAVFEARDLARLLVTKHRVGEIFDDYDLPTPETPRESLAQHPVFIVNAAPSTAVDDFELDYLI